MRVFVNSYNKKRLLLCLSFIGLGFNYTPTIKGINSKTAYVYSAMAMPIILGAAAVSGVAAGVCASELAACPKQIAFCASSAACLVGLLIPEIIFAKIMNIDIEPKNVLGTIIRAAQATIMMAIPLVIVMGLGTTLGKSSAAIIKAYC